MVSNITVFPECEYGIDSLDLRPPLECFNYTECEEEWPCELREYWHEIHPFVEFTRCFLSYGTIFFCVLGIILNSVSFYVLISSGLAKNGSGIYLVTLAICDTGNLIFNYAVGVARGEIEEFNLVFQNDEILCRFHGVFVEIFQLISAWIVVAFTVERCIAVWYPFMLRASKPSRSRTVVITFSTIFTLFSLSKLFLVGFEKDSVFGYQPCTSHRYVWQDMAYIRVAFQTWIPTVLVGWFNCLMFWKLRRIKINRKRLTAYRRSTLENNRNIASRPSPTTPMLIAVSVAYLILVFPLGIVQTIELYWNIKRNISPSFFEPQKSRYINWMQTKLLLKYIRCFCFGFYQINFTINFFLYCAAGIQFRVFLLNKLKVLWNHLARFWCCPTCDTNCFKTDTDEMNRNNVLTLTQSTSTCA